jgi:hypothetical protein
MTLPSIASSLGAMRETVLVVVVARTVAAGVSVGVGKLGFGEEGTANKLHAVRDKNDNISTSRKRKLD